MGQANRKVVSVKDQLADVRDKAESRMGKVAVTGRYHLLPRKLEDDFRLGTNVLGTGLNGAVLTAVAKDTGREVAVKPYTSVHIQKDEQRMLRNEVEIFLSIDHPHIARLEAVYEEIDRLLLVMEVCKGGDILSWIDRHGSFSEAKAAVLIHQMLLSVNYLHSQNIVHRDLKLDNFLFESSDSKHVKLIDFGMSRYWTNNKKMKLACGTIGYMAPECLQESYTIKCDMWSMGVIAYVLLSGHMPFSGNEDQKMKDIKAGRYSMDSQEWSKISEQGKDFVRRLMMLDVDARLSAEDALQHPFIVNRDAVDGNQENLLDDAVVKSLQDFSKATEFRRVCLQLMTYSLTLEERQKVREAFLTIDHDQTGALTLEQFKEVLGEHVTDAEAKNIFSTLDANHDDTIHYSDFLAGMLSSRIASNENYVRAAFNRLDVDGSGVITLENLREVLGDSHNGREIEELFKEADLTHDGVISYDELMAYIQSDTALPAHQEAVCRVIEKEQKKNHDDPNIFKPVLACITPKNRKQEAGSPLPETKSAWTPTEDLAPLAVTNVEATPQPERETAPQPQKPSAETEDHRVPPSGQEPDIKANSCVCILL
jgi:calcium-dependent protein kinase